jgi:PST family polysaccharide transporter
VSLRRKAFTGTLWSLLENTGAQASSFVLFLVFARLIDPRSIGLVQVAVTFVTFFTIFVEGGFATAIVQSREVRPSLLNTAFVLSVGGGTFIALALMPLAPYVARAYRIPELTAVVRTLAWVLPVITLATVQSALLTRELSFRTLAKRRLVAVVAGGVVGVVLAFRGFGVWALVARFGVEMVMACVMAWVLTPWRPSREVSRDDAGVLTSFSSRIIAAGILAFFTRRVDDIVVGLFLGPVALGYFAVATRSIVLVTEVALRAAQRTALPIFSRLRERPERTAAAFHDAIELAAALATPVFVGLSAVSEEVCLAVFGAKWLPVVPAMRIVGFSGGAIAVSAFIEPLLVSAGRPLWVFYVAIFEAAVSVGCSLAAVRFGLVAVAVGYVVRSYAALPAGLYLARRGMGISIGRVVKASLAPAFAAGAMWTSVTVLRTPLQSLAPFTRLMLLVPAGAVVYAVALLLVARPTLERIVGLLRSGRLTQG